MVCSVVALLAATVAGMLVLGASDPPPALASVSRPFEKIDFSDLPAVEMAPAHSGASIAFREWKNLSADKPALIVIAIHGSSAASFSLHPLAKALSMEGLPVYAPDIRGHGQTGRHGDIDYPQQLDDDLVDLVTTIKMRHPQSRLVLLGISAGGGFALHVAGSQIGKIFERIVLLSPMLDVRAPTVKPAVYAWARPFIPRIIALLLLNHIGIHAFDHLPAIAFAIPPDRADILTGSYSFLLMRAFGSADYVADLKNASAPISVLVGERDELFNANLFAPTIHAVRPDVPVEVIPGLSHVEITTDPRAISAIIKALRAKREP